MDFCVLVFCRSGCLCTNRPMIARKRQRSSKFKLQRPQREASPLVRDSLPGDEEVGEDSKEEDEEEEGEDLTPWSKEEDEEEAGEDLMGLMDEEEEEEQEQEEAGRKRASEVGTGNVHTHNAADTLRFVGASSRVLEEESHSKPTWLTYELTKSEVVAVAKGLRATQSFQLRKGTSAVWEEYAKAKNNPTGLLFEIHEWMQPLYDDFSKLEGKAAGETSRCANGIVMKLIKDQAKVEGLPTLSTWNLSARELAHLLLHKVTWEFCADVEGSAS